MENGDHSLDFNTAQENMMKSFNSLAFGLRLMKMYDQPKHRTNIMGGKKDESSSYLSSVLSSA